MTFTTTYKNISFSISLEKKERKDLNSLLGDKFNRLPNHVALALKKGQLGPYNVVIISKHNDQEFTHYLNDVLLTTDESLLTQDFQDYLESEGTLELICSLLAKYALDPGPAWRIE